ncbi:mechanosensitive ion channel [Synechococcus sp. HJ21-Hayes]|jgi:MscS family membrane protein|uniref:mechanosensitive ion channel family protein n=1 Tax=unclassified Synechococcus TaxID=2626047 RepID=UPI0020CFBD70|nr:MULTISPECIES: mechanosensitive ion channel domain-containing protein [unclassified Synechococcus]MCP9832163.1 mechanosensitive ion channel [Synechococcus sp. JJ3a-Johnson]MCP9853719.1 mechanosensitive ion channel [Synechococcus sp. HJ21-Hayes]
MVFFSPWLTFRIRPPTWCWVIKRQIWRLPRLLTPLAFSIVLLLGSLMEPVLASPPIPSPLEHQLVLRQVPGPSPRQTIDNFLTTTEKAQHLIHGAICDGLANPGWLYSSEQRQKVEEGQRLLAQATEALNLSQLPQVLHPITGVGTMLQLRSLLLYDLANHPALVLPGPDEVARMKLSSWTIPESPITLELNQSSSHGQGPLPGLPCKQCSEQDFLFSPRTIAQVNADFAQIFDGNHALRHRFGGDLYVTWSLLPGGALPPKWILRLPNSWRHVLVETAYGGQSLVQWMLQVPASVLALAFAAATSIGLRHQFRNHTASLGLTTYWVRVGLLLPVLLLIAVWRWFSIDWVNLTGDRALVVVVAARILHIVVAMPLVYLLSEAVGQSLIRKCKRQADGTVTWLRRKGAGQLLTVARVIGLTLAIMVFIQGARSLGLTSVTILALSSVPALAISLGTQQLIRDISDGFSLFLDGQIKVGDKCTIGTAKSGQIDGTVLSMGMRSIHLQLKNGSQLAIPNSQVAGSVVTNHSVRTAEPLDLRLSLPKLETNDLVQLKSGAEALLLAAESLDSAEAHLDHTQEGWWLQVKGRWLPGLSSADLPHRRDDLFLALHRLIASLEGGVSSEVLDGLQSSEAQMNKTIE